MSEVKADRSKQPQDSDFKQQRLPAWQPLLTPQWVIGSFFVIAVVFIPLGAVITVSSNDVVELRLRYDDNSACSKNNGTTCTVFMDITADMSFPVYVYYELSNYYQNHRRYVKSRSDEQLRGKIDSGISNCDPEETGQSGKALYACGLISASVFNDTFTAQTCDASKINCATLGWYSSGIAWQSDKDEKFKEVANFDTNFFTQYTFQGVKLKNVSDEEFIVWMRTAGLPTFKKLHRRIDSGSMTGAYVGNKLHKGNTIRIDITNNYDVSGFNGEKHIVFSTTSWLGGKNPFLGIAYLTVGAICFVLACVFLGKHIYSPRQLGDLAYFSWSEANKGNELDD